MRPRFTRTLPPVAALVAAACGNDPGGAAAPTAASNGVTLQLAGAGLGLPLRLETARFRLYAETVPQGVLQDVAAALERELPRFEAELQASATRPFTVRMLQDQAAWLAEVERYFGRRIDTPGYVTGPDELRLLAVPRVAVNATHELAHCVSLYLNPTIANNPRWLWESVALYENGELVDPRSLDYMVAGRPPTLSELDADVTASRRVYEVGYTIGEFVVDRGGRAALVRLILANGDTAGALGLTPQAFVEEWYAFVRRRYLG